MAATQDTSVKRGPGRPRKDPAGTQKELAKKATKAAAAAVEKTITKEVVSAKVVPAPKAAAPKAVIKKPERKGPTAADLRRQMQNTVAKKLQ